MGTWILIPVKPFREGKSRLAKVLQPEERERLNRWLLQRTLRTLQQVDRFFQVMVVSRDSAVLAKAREEGAHTLKESRDTTLNRTLQRAVALLASTYSISHVLILPVDLPQLQSEDVELLLDALTQPLEEHPGRLVIAPDHQHQGTNALGLVPVDPTYTFAFGDGSFFRHIRAAQRQGWFVQVVDRPGLAYDLDKPEDLYLVTRVFPQWQARVLGSLPS